MFEVSESTRRLSASSPMANQPSSSIQKSRLKRSFSAAALARHESRTSGWPSSVAINALAR
jgi:hypothetical protein